MAKIPYHITSSNKSNRDLLDKIIKITADYDEMGYRVTVRQVYYQLVSRNILPNTISSYRKTSKLLTVGRMNGEIDWNVIVDKLRKPVMPNEFETMPGFLGAAINSYRKPRWEGQKKYVEVLVEKESLAGILEPVARKYHVSLLADKGYLSYSAMHEAAERIKVHSIPDKSCHVLYLGDHDPSGVDMTRDIEDRLRNFLAYADVERIALTADQIEKYELPPNPAKMKDPRSGRYVSKYGRKSWELDALKPGVLADILESNIKKHMNMRRYNAMVREEEREKAELGKMASKMQRSD